MTDKLSIFANAILKLSLTVKKLIESKYDLDNKRKTKLNSRIEIINGFKDIFQTLMLWFAEVKLFKQELLYEKYPWFKYLFYAAMILNGLWGLIRIIIGTLRYIKTKKEIKEKQKEIEHLTQKLQQKQGFIESFIEFSD